jgi:cell division protein FtsQ
MARKGGPTPDDELDAPRAGSHARVDDFPGDDYERDGVLDAARLADLESEQESPFLRAQKRVPVRKGPISKKTGTRLKHLFAVFIVVGMVGTAGAAVYYYARTSPRFFLESSDSIEVVGNENVTRGQVLEILGGDIRRNIFSIPLSDQKKQLEQIPWVESATIMRLLPNRLRVEIQERTPRATVLIGSRFSLIDRNGVVMERPIDAGKKYSFPVIVGVTDADPLSTRQARMKIYMELVRQLDADGSKYSEQLSDVDLSDPEDVKVMPRDAAGDVLVHMGSSGFLERYKVFLAHIQEWRQQQPTLKAVDLRYEGQYILQTEADAVHQQITTPTLSQTARQGWGTPMSAGTAPSAQVAAPAVKPVAKKPAAKATKARLRHAARVKHRR